MAKEPRYEREQPLWRRKSVLVTVLVLVIAVSAGLIINKAARTPTPTPKPMPVPAPKPAPAPSTPTLKIPDELGGEVQMASLEKLYSVAQGMDLNQAYLRLSIAGQARGSTPHVKTGQQFTVIFRSSHHCYFALFHKDSSGEILLAAPRPSEPTKLEKIEGERIPANAAPPGGEQSFLFVCADAPIKLQSVLSGDPQTYRNAFAATQLSYFAQEK